MRRGIDGLKPVPFTSSLSVTDAGFAPEKGGANFPRHKDYAS